MSEHLKRLIAAYKWLEQERQSAVGDEANLLRTQIDRELDRLFGVIVGQPGASREAALAQLELIVDQLERLAAEQNRIHAKDLALLLRTHLKGMSALNAASLPDATPKPLPLPRHLAWRKFNTTRDRGAYVDRDYRYRCTNIANAVWHRTMPSDFVDRPAWHVVPNRYFEELMRPTLDRCFAGEFITYTVCLKARGQQHHVEIRVEPVLEDESPQVAFACVMGRELHLPDTERGVDYTTRHTGKIARLVNHGSASTALSAENARDKRAQSRRWRGD